MVNLNRLAIKSAMSPAFAEPISTPDATTYTGEVEVLFRNIESRLLSLIAEADVVVGCVAWLTHAGILEALAQKKGVSLVVQKEDFLRPEGHPPQAWARKLERLYNELPCKLWRMFVEGLEDRSWGSDPVIEPVRCVGNHNSDKQPAFPRMHNKFVIFCKSLRVDDQGTVEHFAPYAVWTGSFNFTANGVRSLENAVVLRNSEIVRAYWEEYINIVSLSEPLDWKTPWCEPEWRIGS